MDQISVYGLGDVFLAIRGFFNLCGRPSECPLSIIKDQVHCWANSVPSRGLQRTAPSQTPCSVWLDCDSSVIVIPCSVIVIPCSVIVIPCSVIVIPCSVIPLTPSHCHLLRQWCQARAHWRMKWRSAVFSDEIRFCLGASDDHGRSLHCKGVSTSATFVFTIDAIISATDPVSRNRCTKSVIFDAFGAALP
ncbi:hypothetical protein TNCV_494401 [Trichonephila clavipes]|nr:hypothetical protein TNCV_494401 [Trichonephila clavipes]